MEIMEREVNKDDLPLYMKKLNTLSEMYRNEYQECFVLVQQKNI